MDFAVGEGMPGRVFKNKKPEWISDVTQNPNFPRARRAREINEDIGIKGTFAFPVLEGERVALVLEFFSEKIESPNELLLEVITNLAIQLGRVTERIRAEQYLKESEERYRSLAETATDAIITADGEGNVISWNRSAETIFGYTEEEMLGKPLTILMPEKYRDLHQNGLKRAIGGDDFKITGKTMELFGCRKGGPEFPLEASVATWNIGGKNYYSGIIRDISERKRTERELSEKTRLVQLIHEITVARDEASAVEEAILICLSWVCKYTGWPVGHAYKVVEGSNGRPLSISAGLWHLAEDKKFDTFKRLTETTDFAPGEGLPGRVLQARLPAWIEDVTRDPNFPRAEKARAKLLEIGVHGAFAFPMLAGDRVLAVLEFFSPKVENTNKSLMEVIANLAIQLGRIAERKGTEEILRTLNNAMEQVADMIIITDSEGTIEYVNPAFERITGYAKEEAIGRNPKILKSGKHGRDFYKQFWDTIKSGKTWRGEWINKRKSGELYEEESTVTPVLDDNGKVTHFAAIKRDVTETKKLRLQLIQSEKLSTIGTFVAGVAHELNNPLTAILGFAQDIMQDIMEEKEPRPE